MDRKNALIIGGVGVASVLSFGLYYYLTKNKKIHLSPWLEDYVKDVESRLAVSKDNPNVETILHTFKLCSELEEYLYHNESEALEDERLEKMNNKEVYEHLVDETERRKDNCTTKAVEYLEKRLGISFNRLHEIIKEVDRQVIRRTTPLCDRAYRDLPGISKESLKEAYKSYVQLIVTCDNVSKQQLAIIERNQEYEGIAMKIINLNRCLLEDSIRKKYGVRPKYLNQLLKEHCLLDDPEIKGLHDTFMAL
jgi:hypothetical protein